MSPIDPEHSRPEDCRQYNYYPTADGWLFKIQLAIALCTPVVSNVSLPGLYRVLPPNKRACLDFGVSNPPSKANLRCLPCDVLQLRMELLLLDLKRILLFLGPHEEASKAIEFVKLHSIRYCRVMVMVGQLTSSSVLELRKVLRAFLMRRAIFFCAGVLACTSLAGRIFTCIAELPSLHGHLAFLGREQARHR